MKRFIPIAFPDGSRIRFIVADVNCLDVICECQGRLDAELIADTLNQDKNFPPRMKIEFGELDGWKRPPMPDPAFTTLQQS